MWGKAIYAIKHNEPIILHQTASYLAVDVELRLYYGALYLMGTSKNHHYKK